MHFRIPSGPPLGHITGIRNTPPHLRVKLPGWLARKLRSRGGGYFNAAQSARPAGRYLINFLEAGLGCDQFLEGGGGQMDQKWSPFWEAKWPKTQ